MESFESRLAALLFCLFMGGLGIYTGFTLARLKPV